jgi:hypothetical protein
LSLYHALSHLTPRDITTVSEETLERRTGSGHRQWKLERTPDVRKRSKIFESRITYHALR